MKQEEHLKDFKFTSVLQNSAENNTLILLGHFGDEQKQAILIFRKKNFSNVFNNNLDKLQKANQYFENDIFRRYNIELENNEWNEIDLQTIYPATQKLIDKYTKSDQIIIIETPKIYHEIVKKYIDEVKSISLQWLYNILEGKAEQESILFRDPHEKEGFILLPNFSFSDYTQTEQLYVLAITQTRDLRSLRDLDGSHIALLENILKKGEQIIKEKYQVSKNKLRIFFHYQPTYYHLHIHFTHIEVQETSMNCDRSHPLHQVIHNLKMDSDYYKKSVLMYKIQSNNPLYHQLKHISENEE